MRVKRSACRSTRIPNEMLLQSLRLSSTTTANTTQNPNYLSSSQLIDNNNIAFTQVTTTTTATSLLKSANTPIEIPSKFFEDLYSDLDPTMLLRIKEQLTLPIHELITPKRKSRRGQTPRPQNSFVLYRHEIQARLTRYRGPKIGANLPLVSKIASNNWEIEPQEVKQVYETLAELAKKVHLNVHPDYVYKPKKRKDKKSTKFDYDVEEEDLLRETRFSMNEDGCRQNNDCSYNNIDIHNDNYSQPIASSSWRTYHSSSSNNNLPSIATLTTLLRSPSPSPHMNNYDSGDSNNEESSHEYLINDMQTYPNSPIQHHHRQQKQEQIVDNKIIVCNEFNCTCSNEQPLIQQWHLKTVLPQIESARQVELSDSYDRGMCRLFGAP
ncbi:10801_t:CDS:2 [Ambispora gerdemannii]|uniref:10801_t:CDS:1 n=1 Tax=Ambispora gerdemannii TaxID=144530 RepID=A0A9N8ZCA4_9GLOM|nr:10801_t:CDS:2 [Ambispora gerdemannii]